MNAETSMTPQQQGKDVTPQPRESASVLLPPVDIYEDDNGIMLYADLPGVSSDRLHIQVDDNVLSIEGDAAFELPQGMEPLYAEVRSNRYRRSFTLSRELQTDKIEANLQNGILKLFIPKQEAVRPRRIEVKAS